MNSEPRLCVEHPVAGAAFRLMSRAMEIAGRSLRPEDPLMLRLRGGYTLTMMAIGAHQAALEEADEVRKIAAATLPAGDLTALGIRHVHVAALACPCGA